MGSGSVNSNGSAGAGSGVLGAPLRPSQDLCSRRSVSIEQMGRMGHDSSPELFQRPDTGSPYHASHPLASTDNGEWACASKSEMPNS